MDAKKLRELCDGLFQKRSTLLSLWQEIAENFYPQRADFTFNRHLGAEFAANLTTSYPILVARDLSDQLSTMLRPTAKPWFHMGIQDDRRMDNDGRQWMEWATNLQRRAMYDRKTQFTRATKEGDNDFGVFGGCVIAPRINWKSENGPHLLYKCHHLRDAAWLEDEMGELCLKVLRRKPTVRDLVAAFGTDKLHESVRSANDQNRVLEEVNCYHIVVERQMYDGALHENDRGRDRFPRISLYYDTDHDHLIDARPTYDRVFIVPRWQTVSGSQYPFSPATVAALPEARLIQAMAYTLLEAGEKLVNPPMVATTDVVRSDIDIAAGGVTWVDMEYDERLGPAVRALEQETKGMPIGIDMMRDSRALIAQCFFLNKLTLPQRAPEMTAYEIGQRVQEWIRAALPIFEPMEMEYNGALCEETFDLLMRANSFGPIADIPKSLQGEDITFHFESPLHDAIEQQKGQKWLEAKTIIADAIALDRSAGVMLDAKIALRDVLDGIGVPAKWMRSEAEVEDAQRRAAQEAQDATILEQITKGAGAAKDLASANKDIATVTVPA